MSNLPSVPTGTVTFLFTDIEGSTKLAQEYPDSMPVLLARHHEILHQSIQSHNGYVFQIVGDSFSAAFHSASDALNAALDAQRKLHNEVWTPAPIKVRMGLHTGVAQLTEGQQYSSYATLASTQRIMSAGYGGQILLSGATRELVRGSLPENAELMDLGERKLKDLLRPEHLYQLNATGLLSTFPPLKTVDTFLNNLPTQLTTFIGREKEIAEVKNALTRPFGSPSPAGRGETRLVTLTGSGGAGKTRLSLQVGAGCLEQFTNGVWFVELAALTDSSLVISAVLSAFGLQEKDNDVNVLASHIGNHSTLLILDNCEHLIEACARLAEHLLKTCPNLRMLASSREAFGIAGEHPYYVPALPFPDPKHLPELDEVAKYESVQLFIERVKTYNPLFSLTDENASALAQICSRLDGIPLALELAAARVKVMSVEQLASRLGDVFNLLTSGSRTALPRQQTLRALIEWSYDLLSESEQSLFRRLAAFSGGWSLEAAEAVCSVGQDGILPHDVIDNLARLVDKSLVVKEEFAGEARFHMLETIRQYAEFKLFAAEEVEEVKNRHRDWFMQLAEIAEPKLRTGKQLTWLNRLETEHDNLRAAIRWSLEQKQTEEGLRIPSALSYFWEIHGHHEEGRNWFRQALGLDEDAKKNFPTVWANAVHGVAALSAYTPQFQSYEPQVKEAVSIFRERGDDFRLGHTLYHLAYFPHFAGELETAKATYEESLDVYKKINNQWGMGECLHCIAHVEEQQGNTAKAHELYNQSLEALNPIGDRFSLFHPMGDSAHIAFNKGELNTARMILEESVQAFKELGNREWTSISFNRLTELFCEQGEYENARKIIQRNLQVQRETNNLEQLGWSIELKGKIGLAEGNLSLAREMYNEAYAIAEGRNHQYSMGFVKAALGLIDCYEGNYRRGKEAIESGIEKVRNSIAHDATPLLAYRSHALWLEKDIQSAARSYRDTIRELQRNYFFIRIPECLEGMAKIAVVQNQPERAARLCGAAEFMRQRMGTPIPPIQRGEYEAGVSELSSTMDESELRRIWDGGRIMTMDDAIQFALEED